MILEGRKKADQTETLRPKEQGSAFRGCLLASSLLDLELKSATWKRRQALLHTKATTKVCSNKKKKEKEKRLPNKAENFETIMAILQPNTLLCPTPRHISKGGA